MALRCRFEDGLVADRKRAPAHGSWAPQGVKESNHGRHAVFTRNRRPDSACNQHPPQSGAEKSWLRSLRERCAFQQHKGGGSRGCGF